MEELTLNQMEMVKGDLSNRDCMVRGAATALAIIGGFFFQSVWGEAFVLSVTTADCCY